jgi:Zn-dependent protease
VADPYPVRGYIMLGEINRAALRVHFATPFAGLLVSGGNVNAPVWAATVFLILVHELGHAIAAWKFGFNVTSIDVLPFGGVCRYEGFATPLQDSVVAFAGVWAQLLAYAIARPVHTYLELTPQMKDFVWVFTTPSLILCAINMLPIPPLDGPAAWAFFPRAYRRIFRKGRREKTRGKVNELDAKLNAPKKAEPEKKKEWLN